MRRLTLQDGEDACLGGGVFACGGGGWYEHGLKNARVALGLGRIQLVEASELPTDGLVVTASAIGAPASNDFEMWPRDYIKAFELVRDAAEADTGQKVVALMVAQNGYSSTVNAWMPAASFGLPVLDAAGDVRAHPTIKLGAMGYAAEAQLTTIQAVVGGKRDEGAYLEVIAKGSLFKTSNILRLASVQAGGFIASARLPLPVSLVAARAALGSVSRAIDLGRAMREASGAGGRDVIDAILTETRGFLLGTGRVVQRSLDTHGGFDHGFYRVDSDQGILELTLLNEFLTADRKGVRVNTFPDTLSVLDAGTGLPLKSKDIYPGREVSVLHVPYDKLPLGAGPRDPAALKDLEELTGLEILKYLPESWR